MLRQAALGRNRVLADWISLPGTCHSQRIAKQPNAASTAAGHKWVLDNGWFRVA